MLDSYSGATRVIYIVGDPIAQVKSPSGVTRAMRARRADAVVVPAHVKSGDLPDFFSLMARVANVDGIIVTVPHKFDAALLVQRLSPRAQSIGAVNVVRRDANDAWYGDMVDGEGYVVGLRKAGCEPKQKRALLVGAGGAGSAIAHALVDAGVESLAVHETDLTRRETLIAKLRRYGNVPITVGSGDPSDYDLVINATPMGMKPTDPLPIDVTKLTSTIFVGDVVTQPVVPPIIEVARQRGCNTMNGVGMFEAVRDYMVEFFLAPRG